MKIENPNEFWRGWFVYECCGATIAFPPRMEEEATKYETMIKNRGKRIYQ